MNCEKKLVITMSIEDNQGLGSEALEATLKSVSSNNQTKNLFYPIKIAVSKSKVKARYPLNYIQDFNNKPKELLISRSVFDCSDGGDSSNPTCGWKYDSQGNRIWDSQGYCCTCDFLDFLGIDKGNYERGYACQAFNLGSGSATAFCLVWDGLWYSSYEILDYSIYFTITVQIASTDENGNYTLRSYELSPTIPIISTPKAILRLIGDFSPYSPPPSFDSTILFTPSRPVSNTRVQVGSPYWMGIDRSMISFDGTECNKVGTSYTGFRGQANKCSMQVNSCFQNQLDDLHQQDITRESNNEKPLHFMSRYGDFSTVTLSDTKYLDMETSGSFPSMISIELNADSLKFITNLSKGIIDLAQMTNFQALTLNGNLLVQVTNVGNINAQFTLGVVCSTGVSPVPSQPLSMDIMETKQVNFKITVISEIGRNYYCNVTLLDSIGDVSDLKTVYFNTSDLVINEGTEGGNGNTPQGSTSAGNQNLNLGCSDYCPSWYDLPCFIVKGCWGNFFGFFGIVIGILVALVALKFIIRRYGFCCQKCFPPSGPSVVSKENNNPEPNDNQRKTEKTKSITENNDLNPTQDLSRRETRRIQSSRGNIHSNQIQNSIKKEKKTKKNITEE
jgi:Male gamete fusion factor